MCKYLSTVGSGECAGQDALLDDTREQAEYAHGVDKELIDCRSQLGIVERERVGVDRQAGDHFGLGGRCVLLLLLGWRFESGSTSRR